MLKKRNCKECDKVIISEEGRKTLCGNQSIRDSCAWISQKRRAKEYYYTHLKFPKKKVKKRHSEESDWCDYPCHL